MRETVCVQERESRGVNAAPYTLLRESGVAIVLRIPDADGEPRVGVRVGVEAGAETGTERWDTGISANNGLHATERGRTCPGNQCVGRRATRASCRRTHAREAWPPDVHDDCGKITAQVATENHTRGNTKAKRRAYDSTRLYIHGDRCQLIRNLFVRSRANCSVFIPILEVMNLIECILSWLHFLATKLRHQDK